MDDIQLNYQTSCFIFFKHGRAMGYMVMDLSLSTVGYYHYILNLNVNCSDLYLLFVDFEIAEVDA